MTFVYFNMKPYDFMELLTGEYHEIQINSIVSEVVRSGDYAGKHFASDNSGYFISQTVNSVTAGTTYNFSSWVNILLTSDVFNFQATGEMARC